MIIEESNSAFKETLWEDVSNEEIQVNEWNWEPIDTYPASSVLSTDCKEVTFHPAFSSGTAALRGDTALQLNHQYYWEIKVLSMLYGTDVMIGVGTPKVDLKANLQRYASSLGEDKESWGFSYNGKVQHDGEMKPYGTRFTMNSVIGVRLDMWRGSLEFYVDRVPQGVAFCDLRRHPALYPMICSTAAQSTMRLMYASSWPASLLSLAARHLTSSFSLPPQGNDNHSKRRKVSNERVLPWFAYMLRQTLQKQGSSEGHENNQNMFRIPPGLWNIFRSKFFLLMPFGQDATRIKAHNRIKLQDERIFLNNFMDLQRRMADG